MNPRLLKKAVLIAVREKKMFMIFTLMYTTLIFLTSYSVQNLDPTDILSQGGLGVLIVSAIIISLLYAWLIVSRNRRTWATLKCIGYTSSDVNWIISGYILFTTILGFVIVLEVLFHQFAIYGYYLVATNKNAPVTSLPLIQIAPVVYTAIVFLIAQLIGIFFASRKINKVRPIIALKKVGVE